MDPFYINVMYSESSSSGSRVVSVAVVVPSYMEILPELNIKGATTFGYFVAPTISSTGKIFLDGSFS